MKSADIKPRHWYATEKKYGNDDTFLVLGTDRYTMVDEIARLRELVGENGEASPDVSSS
jgi:hypothetical protein